MKNTVSWNTRATLSAANVPMLGVNTGTRAKEEGVYLSLAGAFFQERKITDWEKARSAALFKFVLSISLSSQT